MPVRIERLAVAGFKSFGERTTLTFAPGVTAIVGPNGSGKSNLVDALRWATGGGRARAFRAEDKTELIFHGASGKKRMGLADVEVEIGTEDGRVRIRRTLDRDGDTKLKLNGRNARFLDLDEALAGTGLGTDSLAVISQGEVANVLMADPSRLLAYVSEAAGVAQLATRREQTEARLDQARAHLARLDERLEDEATRLADLRREADEAHRYDQLRARANRLRFTAATARARELRAAVAELATRVAEQERALDEGRASLRALRSTLDSARARDAEAETAHREAHAAHARAVAELRVAEHAFEAATTRAAELEDRRERAEREAQGLAEQPDPTPPEQDTDAAQRASDAAAARLREARDRRAKAEADLEAARHERERLEGEAARAERGAAEARARRESLEEQLQEVRAALNEAQQEAPETPDAAAEPATVPADATSRNAGTTDADTTAREAGDALDAARTDLDAARARLEQAQADHAEQAAEARAWERAAQRQRAALEARRGYAEGPRHALTSGVPGVIGSVADLIRVPEELQEAIGLALGRRAEYVVTEDERTARDVLAHVRERGGWVTLLPLSLVRGERMRLDPAFAGAEGVLGLASAMVSCDPAHRPAVEQVLGATALVEDTETATTLARRHARRPRLVSLDGAVLEPGGALSGGRRQGRSPVVGAAADLEETERQRDRLREAEASAQAEVARAQEAFEAARGRVDEAQARFERAREAAAREREARATAVRVRRELETRLARLERDLEALPEPPETVDPERVNAARARETTARDDLAAARTAEAEASEGAAHASQEAALAQERLASHQAALERWRRDRARAQELTRDAERLASDAENAWTAAQEAEARVEKARAAVPNDLGEADRRREEAREEMRKAEAAVEDAAARQTERAEALERARVQRARRETSLEAADQELADFPSGLEPLESSAKAATAELREVEAALERLGPVNHRAAQELDELSAAHDERLAEAEAARAAVSELSTTLERLDRDTTRRLNTAIAGIRDAFGRHVEELFGPEGQGEIDAMVESDRPVGLRIRLRPPGKRTQALGLLSVGERTMGALAFLFALMGEERGSNLPIAVLDEVDAPLDEANIRRYRRFLERLSAQGTQFVLITHQKATFEVADVLWGVTTQDGVSRVFSIRKDQVTDDDGTLAPEASR